MSTRHRGTAEGPSGWTFEMICAACRSSDAALDVTLKLVNPVMSLLIFAFTFTCQGRCQGEPSFRTGS